MRKIIIHLSFILVSINFSNAQVCDKINCEDVKNYINIKIIQETVKTDPNEQSLEEYFKKNTLETPVSYSEFATILDSNNFSKTREKLGDIINSINIKTDYTKEEFASKIMEDVASKLNDKQKKICNFDKLKGKLIDEINTYLDEKILVSDVENVNTANIDPNNFDMKQAVSSQNAVLEKASFFSFSNFNFFTLLSILVPIFLFFILWIRIGTSNKKKEGRKDEIRKSESSSFSNQNANYSNQIPKAEFENLLNNSKVFEEFHNEMNERIKKLESSSFSNQIANNNNQISKTEFENLLNNSMVFKEFHEAIENLQKQASNNMQHASVTPNHNNQQTSVPSQNTTDVFYMKYPVENTFSNNHKSITKENTIYKFFLKTNKSEADFEIHTEGVKIDEIISMVERTIKTGCDEDNNPSVNTRNIRTLKKGIVSLEGDKWVIKRKALIRYE